TLTLKDYTPPSEIAEIWYQVRKRIGDIRGTLPDGVRGPFFNDEFGDVFGSIYALSGDGFSMAELEDVAEQVRQRLLQIPDVNKVDILGTQPQRIFVEISHVRLATLGVSIQQIFDSLRRQNAVAAAGRFETPSDRVFLRVTGQLGTLDAVRAVPVQAGG